MGINIIKKKVNTKTIKLSLVFFIILFSLLCVREAISAENDGITSKIIVKDSNGNIKDAEIKILDQRINEKEESGLIRLMSFDETGSDKICNENILCDIELNLNEGSVNKVIIYNASLKNKTADFGIDDAPESISAPVGEWEEVYAIDPTKINFSNAVVSVIAKGNQLYKCKEWNFTEQRCDGDWTFLKSIVQGEEYNFTLTPEDPGFGEIIAVDAVHLDSNYNFISNIYDKVEAKDDIWSEPVYEGEIVRVTFEKNLTNGSLIDVYVKSNRTIAYFDVYETGTNHLVGRSGITEYPELQYIILENLNQPTDTFDFKVVKFYYDEEDNSTNIDPSINSFIQFDYIHDDAINSTQADGLVAYSESGVYAPRYRIWNESDDFSAELVDAGTIDGLVTWTVTRGCHERDEIIVGTEDEFLSVNVQVYTNGIGWHDPLKVSSSIENSAYRAFDIAYEDISGDALIVYENSNSPENNDVAYRVWNAKKALRIMERKMPKTSRKG